MGATVLNAVTQQQSFGVLIVLYFFLAGLSAGLFLISSLASVFKWEKMRSLVKPAAVLAAVAFAPAPLVLIADLASPERFFMLLFNFNPMSLMAWGTWIVSLYGPVSFWYGWKCWKNETVSNKILLFGTGLALALGTYTGMLIGVVPGRPLWNSAIVPVLFLVSGLVCAAAVLTVLLHTFPNRGERDAETALEVLGELKLFLVVTEAMLITFHLIVLTLASVGARETVMHLVWGPRHIQFIWIQIIMGLVLPMLLLIWAKKSTLSPVLAGLMSVIGVYALRLNFVLGGQETPLMPGSIPDGDLAAWQVFAAAIVLAGIAIVGYRFFRLMFLPAQPRMSNAGVGS
ncbi:NrfD/PsrC family molybdoenzyme membrane anchor subunit [Sporolituus thermophilus]|uniref:Formate-dependent nitrite reductase, membrane component NrfD n=1 Tax=Sporolituus thermophilus DSM 23256 TaxID=1123285 RepID=A0A1G7KY19_9FIRM|nr:NrfD/PsrC family molybdoenzyme membrane anchor subunit [Sporolituus thermophilus]SDF42148.1 Formate-dependent nitrite reductase, membrane component NrfD [Sporolituus thermophilus DSM 23256]